MEVKQEKQKMKLKLSQPRGLLDWEFVFIRTNKAYVQVRFSDILYLESLPSGFCRVVTRMETYIVNQTLRYIEIFLPVTRFCRIHSGFIVGIEHIDMFDRSRLLLKKPPEDGSYKMGYAYRTDFAIGTRYVKLMCEQLNMILIKSKRGGYVHLTQKAKEEAAYDEMEWLVEESEKKRHAFRKKLQEAEEMEGEWPKEASCRIPRTSKTKRTVPSGLATVQQSRFKSVGFTK